MTAEQQLRAWALAFRDLCEQGGFDRVAATTRTGALIAYVPGVGLEVEGQRFPDEWVDGPGWELTPLGAAVAEGNRAAV